jgi:hypothetical protein
MRFLIATTIVFGLVAACPAKASTITFGDEDCLNTNCYGASDPTSGATLQGLAANTITLATNSFGHGFPFAPSGDFAGTDQIYVGSTQTGFHDGYSSSPRLNGPQTLTLNYSSLLGPGDVLSSLTLGIAADDFQFPTFGQPYSASVNGVANAALTTELNTLNLGGPRVQFFTIGLDPSIDSGSHILTLTINQGGDGGDGWAVDFLTVGVTTRSAAVPEPATLSLLAIGLAGAAARRRSKR